MGGASSPTELDAILASLRRALLGERHAGYGNLSVFGGFDRFLGERLRLAAGLEPDPGRRRELQALARAVAAYGRASYAARSRQVETALACLDRLMAGPGGPAGRETGRGGGPGGAEPGAGASAPTRPGRRGGLDSPVQYVKGVGPVRARALSRLGVNTVEDLLRHYPRRYLDRSQMVPLSRLEPGSVATVQGRVVAVRELRPRSASRVRLITKARITDGHGAAEAVWFNNPYVGRHLRPGVQVILSGKVDRHHGPEITVEQWELFDGTEPLHTGRIVPLYPATEGLEGRALRSIVRRAIDSFSHLVTDCLPDPLRRRLELVDARRALEQIHFPEDHAGLEAARRRLVFEEFFLLQVALAVVRQNLRTRQRGIAHPPSGPLVEAFLRGLPFSLTGAQRRVIGEIYRDMEAPEPMNRLVQGDVGSGKTIVAAAALVKTVEAGCQGVMMAPTEILARQHRDRLGPLLEPLGISVAYLSGGEPPRQREAAREAIARGRAQVVVGTHALIQETVAFHCLGLAVTDEQHRFGVRQRARLQEKGEHPDVLVMTATPIPRTLTMTAYGDLDVSILDELPPGRQAVETRWEPNRRRAQVYALVRRHLEAGRQAYVVCPLIEESEKLSAEAATRLRDELAAGALTGWTVGLLHGRLNPAERERVMADFQAGRIHVLVATTVVEVGVDVPNATVMVVEGADRFGLAQLHQLRGRVGRGRHASVCVLLANPATPEGRQRLEAITRLQDGFAIAEADLTLRGPGELLGTRQHGLPEFRLADLVRDAAQLEQARREAFELVSRDPQLKALEHQALRREVLARYRENAGLILVG